MIEEK